MTNSPPGVGPDNRIPAQARTLSGFISKAVIWGTVVLSVLHIVLHLWNGQLEELWGKHITRWFDLNAETSVSTWFSVGLILLLGCSAGVAAASARSRATSVAWGVLAVLSLALSLDEKISIHEALPDLLGRERGAGITHEWLLPGVIIGGLAVLTAGWFLRSLDRVVKRGLVMAAGLFFGGAVGVELLSGMAIRVLGPEHLLSRAMPIWEVIEESLELLGAGLALVVVLRHLEDRRVVDSTRWRVR